MEALTSQVHPPDEVIVVARRDDDGTLSELAQPQRLPLLVVQVDAPGVTAAMCAGVARATCDVVAFTDDDAAPRPEWLQRIVPYFDRPAVGGVGGRDVVVNPAQPSEALTHDVGRVSYWGRVVGNHHRGTGSPQSVQVLKSVNAAYRMEAIEIPQNLRGTGAQVHHEVAIGIRAKESAWELVYDPRILVDHYPASRFDEDQRLSRSKAAVANEAYNLAMCMALSGSVRLVVHILFMLAVGVRPTPGVARCLWALLDPSETLAILRRFWPTVKGEYLALADHAAGVRLVFCRHTGM